MNAVESRAQHVIPRAERVLGTRIAALVGTVSLWGRRHQRAGSLRMFALDVGLSFRRKGVGASLIVVENEGRRRDFRSIHLEVAVAYSRLVVKRDGRESLVPLNRWTEIAPIFRALQLQACIDRSRGGGRVEGYGLNASFTSSL